VTHYKVFSFDQRKKRNEIMCTPGETAQNFMYANRYQQIKKLGQGSFGTVYLVHDTKSKREKYERKNKTEILSIKDFIF
jgi:serine/threonine protein kinase